MLKYMTEIVAVLALLVSLGTAFVQFSNWRRGRVDVWVDLTNQTVGMPEPDGTVTNKVYLIVTVRNRGVQTGLDAITLIHRDGPVNGFGYGPVVLEEVLGLRKLNRDVADLHNFGGVRRTMTTGETAVFTYRIHSLPAEHRNRPRDLLARVRLTSGKTVDSNTLKYPTMLLADRYHMDYADRFIEPDSQPS